MRNLALLFLFVSAPVWGAWARVAKGSDPGTGGTGATQSVGPLNCTGANFYAVIMSYYNGAGATTPQYNGTNFPSSAPASPYGESANGGEQKIWYISGVTGSSSVTFTSTTAYASIVAVCYSGVGTIDASDGSTNATTVNVTAGAANELILGATVFDTTDTISCTSGGTVIEQLIHDVNGRSFAIAVCEQDSTSGTNTMSMTGAFSQGIGAAVFTLSGGGGGGPVHRNRLIVQ